MDFNALIEQYKLNKRVCVGSAAVLHLYFAMQSRNKILFYPLVAFLKCVLWGAKVWFTDLFFKISVNVTVLHLGNIFTGFATVK